MTCEEYVVEKVMDLESKLECSESKNKKLTAKVEELQLALKEVADMFEVAGGESPRFSLSVYEKYDKTNFNTLVKIFGFKPTK